MPAPPPVACFPHYSVSVLCCLMFCSWKATCLPRAVSCFIPKVFPLAAFPSGGGTQSYVGKALCRRNRDLCYFDCSSGTDELQLGGGRTQLIKSLGAGCGSVLFGKCFFVTTTLPILILLLAEEAGRLLLPTYRLLCFSFLPMSVIFC